MTNEKSLERIVDAVQAFQWALKDTGLSTGAVEITLTAEDYRTLHAAADLSDMLALARTASPDPEICGVRFTSPSPASARDAVVDHLMLRAQAERGHAGHCRAHGRVHEAQESYGAARAFADCASYIRGALDGLGKGNEEFSTRVPTEREKLEQLRERLEQRWQRLGHGDDYEMLRIIDPNYSWPRIPAR